MLKQLLLLCLLLFCRTAVAQPEPPSDLDRTIREKDSLLFSVGFNTCDIKQFEALVSDSFEFYHDQAGVTNSKAAFIDGIRNGLCKLNYKPKRVLVKNSMTVYPLKKNGVLYGAIQTGEHSFYALESGKPEYLTSTAKFTHLWLLEGGKWKLRSALSYDHKDAGK